MVGILFALFLTWVLIEDRNALEGALALVFVIGTWAAVWFHER